MRAGPLIFLARRTLFGRKSESDRRGRRYMRGAVVGVALSLVPLVVVLVVADGMIQGITSRYIETGTYHLEALPYLDNSLAELRRAASSIAAVRGVTGAYPEMQGPAVILGHSRTAGALIRAIDPSFLADRGTRAYLRALEGKLRLKGGNDILLGDALARNLHARVGDLVSIVTSRDGNAPGHPSIPRISLFRVRGIVSAGYRELDALWAFVPLDAGFRILAPGDSRTFIGIKTADPYHGLARVASAVQLVVGPEWSVSPWTQIEFNLFKSFQTTRALLLLVMTLAVAVAAINVGSALVMLVLERRREIAILKSAGADSSAIGLVFLLVGLTTGGLGTLLGLAIGSLVAWRVNDFIAGMEAVVNGVADAQAWLLRSPMPPHLHLLDPAYYLERIPVHFRLPELFLIAGASLVVCIIASLLPARRAARLPPLEIFRKT
ncbi:MAG: FtsX-like permease family protein [Treponema sp.]|nr:FtsX-like permease family protein [Treponema sp.]